MMDGDIFGYSYSSNFRTKLCFEMQWFLVLPRRSSTDVNRDYISRAGNGRCMLALYVNTILYVHVCILFVCL